MFLVPLYRILPPVSYDCLQTLSTAFAHDNARSLAPHFSSIIDLLRIYEFDILAISESWLRESDDSNMLNINRYCVIHRDRSTGTVTELRYI